LGGGELGRIELPECRCALDQGNLGPPHPRELKLATADTFFLGNKSRGNFPRPDSRKKQVV
jgi:hypothetical protein